MDLMQPLSKDIVFDLIKRQFSGAPTVTIVAPYFGHGAFNHLGFEDFDGSCTIVCDLYSGACNPHEINKFLSDKRKRFDVRTLDRLHAKVYLTESAVVIGSANPSANGLGFEGAEVAGLLEACVASDDKEVVKRWRNFVQKQFVDASRAVDERDIRAAIEIWEQVRRNRPTRGPGKTKTFLSKMRASPEFFKDRNILVLAYPEDEASNAAYEECERQKLLRGTDNLDFWEGWDAPSGATVVEFLYESSESKRPYFNGIFQVLDNPGVVTKGGTKISLAREVTQVLDLAIPKSERTEIARLLATLLPADGSNDDWISAYDLALAACKKDTVAETGKGHGERKYDRLRDYLRNQHLSELILTFDEVEGIIGAKLPKSASSPQWWANVTDPKTTHVQRNAWREAGYNAFLLAGSRKARFRRVAD